MRKLLTRPWVKNIGSVYCSAERKAIDGAEILAGFLLLRYEVIEELGEIDRSSTGYLPYEEHKAAARQLFEHPEESYRGWETAREGQERMARGIEKAVSKDRSEGDIAVVSHGGVATLYLCRVKGCPVSMEEAPPEGEGGYYYCFDAESKALLQGWERIDPMQSQPVWQIVGALMFENWKVVARLLKSICLTSMKARVCQVCASTSWDLNRISELA